MAVERQIAALPPAQPSYILRGHVAQIHSVRFIRQNTRLLTGDADGWIVYWKVETKRALAVWKAHEGAILGSEAWGHDKIITHGRDNSLRIWQVRAVDEATFPTTLPAEQTLAEQRKPWLLHTLPVNTLNFCAFSMCHEHSSSSDAELSSSTHAQSTPSSNSSILIAVPARDDKKIEVYQFPEERLKSVIPRAQDADTGMVMAVRLVHHPTSKNVLVLVGYEGGLTAVFKLPQPSQSSVFEIAQLVYLSKPHTQPVLSLDTSPDGRVYFTSSADAIIACHRIPEIPCDSSQVDEQSNLKEQTRIEPLASEDQTSQVRVDEAPRQSSLQQPDPDTIAVAPEEPVQSLDFSKKPLPSASKSAPVKLPPAGLTSLLSTAAPLPRVKPAPPPPPPITIQQPYKLADTKHAGQQSLHVRSDGRLFVTGGWDTKIRIYSTKTLKEVALLKWHKEGVYATAFSDILGTEDIRQHQNGTAGEGEVSRRETGLGKLQRQREEQMQLKHWVAAGSKDGKVSLWEVF